MDGVSPQGVGLRCANPTYGVWGMSFDTNAAANVGRVSPQGVTRHDGDGGLPQGVGLRCANPTIYGALNPSRT
jgi:hypothetical protein